MTTRDTQRSIACLIALLFSGATLAAESTSLPISFSQHKNNAAAKPAQNLVPPSAVDPEERAKAAPDPDYATDYPSIISIDPAPGPNLKSADTLNNPHRDLWSRIREGFALPELDTPLVQENEQWYAKRPDYVARTVERSKRYLYYIVQEVEKRGMPTEIALLPIVESAFNPKAYSRSHASGIWQFIPSTGRVYGLQQNWWIDGRRDVIAATSAALDYLQRLHGMFGNWELALAAYNWGEGSVSRAQAKNRGRGEPTDYLSLRMPNETQHYVPRLIAVRNLINRPQDFGLELDPVPNEPYFAQITLTEHIDVALAAKLAGITHDEFTSLNPHYNRPVIQAKEPTTLLLPVDKAEVFVFNLENYDKPLVSWQPYHAKRGEKLASIADRYGISLARLQETNEVKHRRGRLTANQILLVPAKGSVKTNLAGLPESKSVSSERSVETTYTVRRGDTLFSIAKRHGVSASDLKTWNKLKSSRLMANQKLVLQASITDDMALPKSASAKMAERSANKSTKTAATKTKRHVVRRGDTLYSIAQRYDVDLDDLLRWNKLSSRSRLHPGDRLTIHLAKNS